MGGHDGVKTYYQGKIDELEILIQDKTHNLRRLEAQRNDLNARGIRPLGLEVVTLTRVHSEGFER